MKITIVGNVLLNSFSGYSVHTRELAKALSRHKDITLNIENVNYSPEMAQYIPAELAGNFMLPNFKADATILILTPDVWPYFYVDKEKRGKLIGFGVFEGDRVPTDWQIKANHPAIDFMFYPSEHAKQAFENGGVRKPSAIIPHGMNPAVFHSFGPKIEPFATDGKFKFLYVGGWVDGVNDRKGLDIALKAFCEEFKAEKDQVEFIAKINTSYGPDPETLRKNIEAVLAPYPKETRGEIHVLGNVVDEKALAALYRTADVFVAPTKADAFHMGCLESMACGVPVITTSYGGQSEYVTDENGWLVSYEMQPATGGMLYEETKWAKPLLQDARHCMREAFAKRDLTKEKGKHALIDAQQFTWEECAKKVVSYLSNL